MHIDKRLLHLTVPVKTDLIFTIIFGLAAAFAVIGQAYFLSDAINYVFLENLSLTNVKNLLIVVIVLSLFRFLFVWLEQNFSNKVATYVKDKLRSEISLYIFKLGPNYTKSERTGDISNTLINGIEKLDAYFSQFLPQLFLSALIPLLILLFVFPIDLLSAIVFLVTAPLIPVFMVFIGSVAEKLNKKQWKSLSLMSAYFLDVIQGLTTIKLFGRTDHVLNKIAIISDLFKKSTMKVLKIAFLSALVLEMFSTISIAIIAVEIGLRLMNGNLEFQPALFILILAPEFYNPIRQLGTRYHAGMEGIAAAQSIYKILETPLPKINVIAKNIKSDFANISFENVHFAYDKNEQEALSGISFNIKPNTITALVGESGSGKSTTINLMLKFLEPKKGKIKIDEKNLMEIDRDEWLQQIGWISQNPYLFHTTIKENILLAKENATDNQLQSAIKSAKLEKVIKSLPNGLDTIIGERGTGLSGGEAQRVALARAFLKDAPILILDEPTANLDPTTEMEMIESLNLLTKNKTVLMIAHRLNTIKQADNILVYSKGKIIESGTHNELLKNNKHYSKLINKYRGN
jgi:ATP-binding cassette subfamily C protein CydD